MTTSNHLLAGSIIALTVKEPVLVLPLAFLSHFLLDALPHYGINDAELDSKSKFKRYINVELVGLIGIIILLNTGQYGWNLVSLAAFLAVLPDIEWPVHYFFFIAKGKKPPSTITSRFHESIQWSERRWGIFLEIIYFVCGYLLFLKIK